MKPVIFFFITSFFFLLSCDGDNQPRRIIFNDAVVDPLLNIPANRLVNFSLSGTVSCQQCDEGTFRADVLQLDVTPQKDPMHSLVQTTVSPSGTFLLEKLRFEKGVTLRVYGKLIADSLSTFPRTLEGVVEVNVPEDENGIEAFTIVFPSTVPK